MFRQTLYPPEHSPTTSSRQSLTGVSATRKPPAAFRIVPRNRNKGVGRAPVACACVNHRSDARPCANRRCTNCARLRFPVPAAKELLERLDPFETQGGGGGVLGAWVWTLPPWSGPASPEIKSITGKCRTSDNTRIRTVTAPSSVIEGAHLPDVSHNGPSGLDDPKQVRTAG